MNLADLYKKLKRDKTFRDACDQIGDRFDLAMHCAVVCEERGITDKDLASATGYYVRDLTNFHQISDDGLARIVSHLEPWLRRRGVDTDYWISLKKVAPKMEDPRLAPQPIETKTREDFLKGLGGRDRGIPLNPSVPPDRLNLGKKKEQA